MTKCLPCECRVVEVVSAVVHRLHRVAYKEWDRICKDSKFDEEELTKTKQRIVLVVEGRSLIVVE